ncbi:MAG: toll/interleukin-1 receptor domain-containing protein, partial [Pseudomonadales bacterium]
MADIFVSYAAEDRARIEPLIEALKSEGWSIWWDRELLAGPRFAETIEHELEAARCVVVVWSERAVTSGWCLDEAGEGLERRRLVPVRIDDVRLPLGFRSLQTASL